MVPTKRYTDIDKESTMWKWIFLTFEVSLSAAKEPIYR